jgi:expansin (peptidoglycan-binding protein)
VLLGFGVTGAGFAAIAVAVTVGVGQVSTGQACTSVRHTPAQQTAALSLSALTRSARFTGTVSGIATHYVLQGLPNCSYPSPPSDGLFVALSPSEYGAAAGCGGYLEVRGPDGSVRVKVIDQCPECATGHIDLSEAAFARLAPLKAGLINVSYTYLADPSLPGPITMRVKQGSSPYWLALLADNTGNPLASVEVRTESGGWLSLARASYNYWIAQSGAGSGPFTVRLTDTAGNQVTVRDVALAPGTVQSTRTMMYGAGSAPSAAPPQPTQTAVSPAAPSPTAPSATAARSASASAPVSPSAARTGPSSTTSGTEAKRVLAPASSGQPTTPVPATSPTC